MFFNRFFDTSTLDLNSLKRKHCVSTDGNQILRNQSLNSR